MDKVFIVIGIMILFAGIAGGAIYGHVNYEYELNKCANMKGSSYEFTHDVQVGANYAQHCFRIKNHPTAYIGNIFLGIFLGGFICIVACALIFFICGVICEF
jgi:hypothetical protein